MATTPRCRCWPRGKTVTGRLWTYVRDDRPFGGPAPPAAIFYLLAQSRRRASRAGIWPAMPGSSRPTPMPGSATSTTAERKTGADHRGGVLGHGRRKLLRAGRLLSAQGARWRVEAVRRIDAIFAHRARDQRPAGRRAAGGAPARRIAPLVADLEEWMRAERARLSRHADVAKAMDYMLKRWPAFTRFLDDGRICLTNNAAERALRGIALGRRAWLFAGSDRGGERAAAMLHPDRHGQAQRHRSRRPGSPTCCAASPIIPPPGSHELLPWHWKKPAHQAAAA